MERTEAQKITNVTAHPIPKAESSLVETPMNGHIPRNLERMMLLISIALINKVKRFIIQPPFCSCFPYTLQLRPQAMQR